MEILDLIESAAALPEAERRAYLSRQCPSRPDLIEEALEALAQREALTGFRDARWIADTMRRMRTALVSLSTAKSDELYRHLVGALRGRASDDERFETIDVIARGASGTVMRVRDRLLGREFARKDIELGTISEKVALPARVTRFVHEVRALASLDHPAIPTFHSAWLAPSGRASLVMRLVRARPVSAWIFGGRDAMFTCASGLVDAARGLHCAHSAGFAHRDISSSNLIVDEAGVGTLVDWGSVASLGATGEPWVEGTLPFLAPELVASTRGAATVQSDVYALGAVLHEVQSGVLSPPAQGDSLGLRAVCERAMHPDPDQRIQSAANFADELERALYNRSGLGETQ